MDQKIFSPVPLIDQLLRDSAASCPHGYQDQFEAAIASGSAARISEFAEEIVQETCRRQLWVLVAHLMYRCGVANSEGVAHG